MWATFVDQPGLKIARIDNSQPAEDGRLDIEFHYLVGTTDGIDYFTERHEVSLFRADQYAEAFAVAGLKFDFEEPGLRDRGVYLAVRD